MSTCERRILTWLRNDEFIMGFGTIWGPKKLNWKSIQLIECASKCTTIRSGQVWWDLNCPFTVDEKFQGKENVVSYMQAKKPIFSEKCTKKSTEIFM